MRSRITPLALLMILTIVVSCDERKSICRPSQGINGVARLENQSEHSGVLLKLIELDSTAVTNADGFFSFADIPDGLWKLAVLYPYFKSDTTEVELVGGLLQRPIEITLSQLLQFSIEPIDTTISMSGSAWDDYHFRMELRGRLENVSEHPVRIVASFLPRELLAIRPRQSYPSDGCDKEYGWLTPLIWENSFDYTFEPGERRMVVLGSRYWFKTPCFEPGEYEVYWSLLDNYFHREHFEPYSDLNWTLLRKRELLRPASLTLTE
jgi:hypothetical protein